jgi:autotransporter-associated beta strand protein
MAVKAVAPEGSLTKIGAETLSLLQANTYSGGTTVIGGALYALHDHALGSGNVTLITPGTTLACQPGESGATYDYIADTATLSIVTTALVNLIYHGTDTIGVLIIDGVAQPPGLYGASSAFSSTRSRSGDRVSGFLGTGNLLAQLPVAVSRKAHGGTPYDVYLPSVGLPGIECRSGGPNNSYQVVVRFLTNATFTSASVTSGIAMVSSVSGNGTTQATINLGAVADQQTVTVTVFGLNDGLGLRDLVIPMAVLVGVRPAMVW